MRTLVNIDNSLLQTKRKKEWQNSFSSSFQMLYLILPVWWDLAISFKTRKSGQWMLNTFKYIIQTFLSPNIFTITRGKGYIKFLCVVLSYRPFSYPCAHDNNKNKIFHLPVPIIPDVFSIENLTIPEKKHDKLIWETIGI